MAEGRVVVAAADEGQGSVEQTGSVGGGVRWTLQSRYQVARRAWCGAWDVAEQLNQRSRCASVKEAEGRRNLHRQRNSPSLARASANASVAACTCLLL